MPNKITAWVTAHKPQAALGAGAVGAVGLGLYKRHKNSGGATPATAAGVPTAATTAAGVVPGGGDSAGGVPFDSGAFDTTASTYLAQISQGLSDLNTGLGSLSTDEAAQTATLGTIAAQTAPHTGGTMTKAPAAVKPKAKPKKATPVAHHTPAPAHKPAAKTRRKPAAKKAPAKRTKKAPARARRG